MGKCNEINIGVSRLSALLPRHLHGGRYPGRGEMYNPNRLKGKINRASEQAREAKWERDSLLRVKEGTNSRSSVVIANPPHAATVRVLRPYACAPKRLIEYIYSFLIFLPNS